MVSAVRLVATEGPCSGVPRGGPTVRGGPQGTPPTTELRCPPLPELTAAGASVECVRVRAPLSIANVGPGFDHFGLCLEGPADVLELRRSRAAGLEVYGDGAVPRDLKRNAATAAAADVFRQVGERFRVQARLFKGFHAGSGIGSSGASAVAGALAAAALLSLDPSDPETSRRVLRAAGKGEAVASGTPHLDNAAATLYGGFVLIEKTDPPIIHRLAVPPDLRVVVALPDLQVPTRKARAVLPPAVPLEDAVANLTRASALIHGLLTGDAVQIGRNLEDRLAEPYREALVPGFQRAKLSAVEAGAWGASLAGSGPAVFALCAPSVAAAVARAFVESFAWSGLPCQTFSSGAAQGASLVGWS